MRACNFRRNRELLIDIRYHQLLVFSFVKANAITTILDENKRGIQLNLTHFSLV